MIFLDHKSEMPEGTGDAEEGNEEMRWDFAATESYNSCLQTSIFGR